MSLPVKITDCAHEDIARNALWWAEHHSYEQAVRWKDAIYEQLTELSLTPERHSLAVENHQVRRSRWAMMRAKGPLKDRIPEARESKRFSFLAFHSAALTVACVRRILVSRDGVTESCEVPHACLRQQRVAVDVAVWIVANQA